LVRPNRMNSNGYGHSQQASTTASSLPGSRAESRSPPTNSGANSPTRGTEKSMFKRMGRRLERSLEVVGIRSRSSPGEEGVSNGRYGGGSQNPRAAALQSAPRGNSVARSASQHSDRSVGSNLTSNHSMNGSPTEPHAALLGRQHSLLSMTSKASSASQISHDSRPSPIASASWSAGPTRSAKEGILREWAMLGSREDDSIWQLSGYEEQHESPRSNGRRLLFAQMRAVMPALGMRELEKQEMIINMLVQKHTGFAVVGHLQRPGWKAAGNLSGTALAYRERGSEVEEIKFF
jgi:hypothetical protein